MKNIDKLGKELSRNIKTQKQMTDLLNQLFPWMVGNNLNAEIAKHPDYKSKPYLRGIENTILDFYAQGMDVQEIQEMIEASYHGAVEISTDAITRVTNAVIDDVQAWQSRLLDAVYAVVYLGCIVVEVEEEEDVIDKSVYLALGIKSNGHKELLGFWISDDETSKFWLSILSELQNRNVKDIFIFCIDGLEGLADTITTVFPKSKVQLCVVHMMMDSLRYVAAKDKREVSAALKKIYTSPNAAAAGQLLDEFAEKWSKKYPSIESAWRSNWDNLIISLDYPPEIRKIIYTTNAIGSLSSVIGHAIRRQDIFPNEQSASKLIYLATKKASARWTMPIRNWSPTLNLLATKYEDGFDIKNK